MSPLNLITTAMEIGDMLLENGAEIYRVEESMRRICHAYGIDNAEIFAVPTTIIITIRINADPPLTLTKRIHSRGIDLNKVALLNALSREICNAIPSYSNIKPRIDAIRQLPPYTLPKQILAFSCVAFFFTLLFGGTFKDALTSFFIGAGAKVVLNTLEWLKTNSFFTNIICGFIIAFGALLIVNLGFAQNIDKIIIGSIMPLVPGLAITNSMRDIIAGDLLAGVTKLTEVLLIGVGIAAGAAIPLGFLQAFGGI